MALYHVTISCGRRRDHELPHSQEATAIKKTAGLLLSYLRALVINVEVPGVIFVLVGDLQPMRMTDLLRLKCGVQVLDGDYSFRAFGLLCDRCINIKCIKSQVRKSNQIKSNQCTCIYNSMCAVCVSAAGNSHFPCCSKSR